VKVGTNLNLDQTAEQKALAVEQHKESFVNSAVDQHFNAKEFL
jgi:hypothetical protein